MPPITALDGDGSEGLILRQSYTVTEIRKGKRRDLGMDTMFAVPSNLGPLTMPRYEDLAAQGIYALHQGARVFAGQRDETFYIDLGGVFDTVNLRRTPFPLLTPGEDADDATNPFGVDHFSGFNINTIALEIPISRITHNPNAVIGMYASTSRPKFTLQTRHGQPVGAGPWVQVARMGNPLVNELIIGTAKKDLWNASDPKLEAAFVDFYRNSRLALALNLRFGLPAAGLGIPETGRSDLVNVLLEVSELATDRRLLAQEPLLGTVALEPRRRSGMAAATEAADGACGGQCGLAQRTAAERRRHRHCAARRRRRADGRAASAALLLGDGVNFNVGAQGSNLTANGIYSTFPFLPTPLDGRNRVHIDCAQSVTPC